MEKNICRAFLVRLKDSDEFKIMSPDQYQIIGHDAVHLFEITTKISASKIWHYDVHYEVGFYKIRHYVTFKGIEFHYMEFEQLTGINTGLSDFDMPPNRIAFLMDGWVWEEDIQTQCFWDEDSGSFCCKYPSYIHRLPFKFDYQTRFPNELDAWLFKRQQVADQLDQLDKTIEKVKNHMIPTIGQTYVYYDDGKVHPSRRYEVIIDKIIPFQEANSDLLEKWQNEVEYPDMLFATETDYFIIGTSIEGNITFARTRDGGWFSIESLIGGRLVL